MQDARFLNLGLAKMTVNAEQICSYSKNLAAASSKNPVLVLLHGYPSSSFMWRHLIPRFPSSIPLFVPDLPGYGSSAPIEKNDKLTVGTALMTALKIDVRRASSTNNASPIPIVLVGHDRGARVAHRLAVSGAEGIQILGVCFLDIVPTLEQWANFANPTSSTSNFHWPLLANVPVANKLLASLGGSVWAQDRIKAWSGSSSVGQKLLTADSALDVYGGFFSKSSVVDASNRDYEAGATVDVERQREDQEKGRKVACPVALIYSKAYLGSRYDVFAVWEGWVEKEVIKTCVGVEGGVGHFVAEEAPEVCADAIGKFLDVLGVEI